MSTMTNISVTIGSGSSASTFTWASRTPAGPDIPARWATGIFNATTRVGDAKLAYKYKRNGVDTADQFKVDVLIPLVCNSQSCGEIVAAKSVCSLSMTVPDSFSATDRAYLVDLICGTINSTEFRNAMKAGESFY